MNWVRVDNTQIAVVNGYEIVVSENNGYHSAVCYKNTNGTKIVFKKFGPNKKVAILKLTIENDILFNEHNLNNVEPIDEMWWQK